MLYLRPMDETEYQQFLDYAITNYAEEKIQAGNYASADAMELSTREYQELLPNGVNTKDSILYMIVENTQNVSVGFVWLMIQQTGRLRYLTLVNILIYEAFRRQGHGTQTLQLIEGKAHALGLERITLHAFGHNREAISLYERVGYKITNVHMAKDVTIQKPHMAY
ncbi:GNAT family N-acetyltransferase [Ktedonobacter racemifer]|uniref:GCN5-related N-acetyltransferase n=1 Tax=Ktedonobacter racemifer DSM 44963 TaxID=485913 RepID=D6U3L1_KTERA|nr:GNAT family N-acetyltransferase [Ktedonobacter racemifer]EFH83001.1 GCN5-related N-acetyltransferase [Ktedonobacter racemifer DSM 44963]